MAVSSRTTSTETIKITACCHCNRFQTTFDLPLSSLPLKASVCHCTTCRKSSGHILPTGAVIPLPNHPDVSALSAYASSDFLTRFFCPNCGASVVNSEAKEWDIATGVLNRTSGGLLNRVQLWLEDTKDGGAGFWLRETGLEMLMRGRTSDKLSSEDVKAISEKSRNQGKAILSNSPATQGEYSDAKDDLLRASCCCGAVSFHILRPDGGSDERYSNRYPAGLDACASCRTVTGNEITSWAMVPRNRITTPTRGPNENEAKSSKNETLDLLDLPALSYYKTSQSVTRGFCSTFGANVFYYRHRGNTGKDDTIDIGAGLLESRMGVRAEDWLVWDHYGDDVVAYREDALDMELVNGLLRGIEEDHVS